MQLVRLTIKERRSTKLIFPKKILEPEEDVKTPNIQLTNSGTGGTPNTPKNSPVATKIENDSSSGGSCEASPVIYTIDSQLLS